MVHWGDPEGWYGEGGGRRVQDGEHMYTGITKCILWHFSDSAWELKVLTCVHARSLESWLTLCNPMDCSLPGSSVHGILQARILEWVAMFSSR